MASILIVRKIVRTEQEVFEISEMLADEIKNADPESVETTESIFTILRDLTGWDDIDEYEIVEE